MEITRPDYYKEFSCIAGACPDTCCAGWQIVIDDKSLKKYKRVKGTFRNRLHNDIDWKEKVFRQYEKRCAFLNEDSLCDIYSEVGKRMLCDTCRKYPRHIEEFEGLREYSLSVSAIYRYIYIASFCIVSPCTRSKQYNFPDRIPLSKRYNIFYNPFRKIIAHTLPPPFFCKYSQTIFYSSPGAFFPIMIK